MLEAVGFLDMSDHKLVLEEHERLDILLRDLRTISKWNPELLQLEKVRVKLGQDLQSLEVRLREHFDTEESGYYLEEISGRKSGAGNALLALQAEHPVFLRILSEIQDQCRQKETDPSLDEKLLKKLSQLLKWLKVHEAKENALIQEVFQT